MKKLIQRVSLACLIIAHGVWGSDPVLEETPASSAREKPSVRQTYFQGLCRQYLDHQKAALLENQAIHGLRWAQLLYYRVDLTKLRKKFQELETIASATPPDTEEGLQTLMHDLRTDKTEHPDEMRASAKSDWTSLDNALLKLLIETAELEDKALTEELTDEEKETLDNNNSMLKRCANLLSAEAFQARLNKLKLLNSGGESVEGGLAHVQQLQLQTAEAFKSDTARLEDLLKLMGATQVEATPTLASYVDKQRQSPFGSLDTTVMCSKAWVEWLRQSHEDEIAHFESTVNSLERQKTRLTELHLEGKTLADALSADLECDESDDAWEEDSDDDESTDKKIASALDKLMEKMNQEIGSLEEYIQRDAQRRDALSQAMATRADTTSNDD